MIGWPCGPCVVTESFFPDNTSFIPKQGLFSPGHLWLQFKFKASYISLYLFAVNQAIFIMSRRTKVARTEADATDVAKQIEVEDKEVTEKRKYKDAHFANLKEVIAARGAKGSVLIIAIEPDEEDEDEDESPDAVYTKEQIDSLRHILVNKSREGFINKAMAMVFMDGEGTTSAGNAVIMSIIPWINKAKKQKTNALRFDALFALTYALLQEDMWMHDNELYGPGGNDFMLRHYLV